jgi:peptidoglycan/LPS O-acetylase OafA/YrhL
MLASDKQTRNIALDVIRGIAVLMVMFFHIKEPIIALSQSFTDQVFNIFKSVILFLKAGGWIGVDFFFVLSGFLVSGLLFKEYKLTNTINPVRFLIRRGFKIYPLFFAFLIATLLFEIISLHFNLPVAVEAKQKYYWWGYILDAMFIHNYANGRWGHSWSLDVEEHFYILLVLYFVYLIKRKHSSKKSLSPVENKLNYIVVTRTYIFLTVVGILARLIANIYHPVFRAPTHYAATHFRLDALFFGVYLAYLYQFYPEKLVFFKKYKVYLLILSIGYLLTNNVFDRQVNKWMSVISLGVHPLCFGSILMIALESKSRFFRSIFMATIGKLSYAIYLWHVFVGSYILVYFPIVATNKLYWIYYLLGYFIISLVAGKLFTAWLEVPFLNIRNKYFPAKTPAPVIANSVTSESPAASVPVV